MKSRCCLSEREYNTLKDQRVISCMLQWVPINTENVTDVTRRVGCRQRDLGRIHPGLLISKNPSISHDSSVTVFGFVTIKK